MTPADTVFPDDPSRLRRYTRDFLIGVLERLVLLREFDLTCERWWKGGEQLVGEFHLSLGQEAFTVGTCAAALPDDPICPSIRGMGVYLSRGVSMVALMASFFERQQSISEGRWAHWHTGVPEHSILPQTGMLGSGLLSAAGVAFAERYLESSRVVVAMLGDGTTNTGNFHEGANFAAVRALPMVIVIENNQFGVSTRISDATRIGRLAERAAGYGMPGVSVDGNDVLAVYTAVGDAIRAARAGCGPTLVELVGYRWSGQTLRDPDTIRPAQEKEAARADCPILRLRQRLVRAGFLSESEFTELVEGVRRRIADAEREARALPRLDSRSAGVMAGLLQAYAE